jgi:prepilin-type N-terminal cleavage/methylation domain-containing protein
LTKIFNFIKIEGGKIMKMNKRGVTLVELLVVFVIIAVGAVLTIPNMGSWIANYRLRTATRDVTSTMRVAQMRAVSNNLNYRVSFDTVAGTYILQRNTGALWVDEGTAQTLPSGVSFATNFGNTLTFNPNSSTSPGITADVTLQNTRGTRIIRVLSSTGRIAILQ